MPPSLMFRCGGCDAENEVEAPKADVLPQSLVNCSHCGKMLGLWRDLAVGDDGRPVADSWPFLFNDPER